MFDVLFKNNFNLIYFHGMATTTEEIFACERTFERIFLGALFGSNAPHFIAGWRSDFKDQVKVILKHRYPAALSIQNLFTVPKCNINVTLYNTVFSTLPYLPFQISLY